MLNIKKTTILRSSFIFNMLLVLAFATLSFVFKGANDDYFFIFLTLLGLHLIIKSALFALDSTCYFGNTLFFIGSFYFYCQFVGLMRYYIAFVLLAFTTASFVTHCFFDRPFHFSLAISLFFVTIFTFMFMIKLISLDFFLAIIGVVVLLLVIRFFTMK